MWIRINDFIINLDNVTNINMEEKEHVFISFNHGISSISLHDGKIETYWNSLAFKKEEMPESAMRLIDQLPNNSWGTP